MCAAICFEKKYFQIIEGFIFGCNRSNSYQFTDLSHEYILVLRCFLTKTCIKNCLCYCWYKIHLDSLRDFAGITDLRYYVVIIVTIML